jgi:hypothetical protein
VRGEGGSANGLIRRGEHSVSIICRYMSFVSLKLRNRFR